MADFDPASPEYIANPYPMLRHIREKVARGASRTNCECPATARSSSAI